MMASFSSLNAISNGCQVRCIRARCGPAARGTRKSGLRCARSADRPIWNENAPSKEPPISSPRGVLCRERRSHPAWRSAFAAVGAGQRATPYRFQSGWQERREFGSELTMRDLAGRLHGHPHRGDRRCRALRRIGFIIGSAIARHQMIRPHDAGQLEVKSCNPPGVGPTMVMPTRPENLAIQCEGVVAVIVDANWWPMEPLELERLLHGSTAWHGETRRELAFLVRAVEPRVYCPQREGGTLLSNLI